MIKIDLHVHTTCSDGNLSIDEVLRLASEEKVQELT